MKHAITAYALTASAALAHGGHSDALLNGPTHWLRAGDHLLVLGLAILAAGLGLRVLLRGLMRGLRKRRARV